MKNRIDFQVVKWQASPCLFSDETNISSIELTIKQYFSRQEFEKVKRIIDSSSKKVHVIFDRNLNELDKYSDEEILEYLRTRNK